jgi:hypothetical protein
MEVSMSRLRTNTVVLSLLLAADLQVVAELQGFTSDDSDYSVPADVDRNGMIDGGDRQRAEANPGAKGPAPEADHPLDQSLPEGAMALVGASPKTFVSRTGGLRFSLAGAELDGSKADITLTINGVRVAAEQLTVDRQGQRQMAATAAFAQTLMCSSKIFVSTRSTSVPAPKLPTKR